jgi:hypothetical protein
MIIAGSINRLAKENEIIIDRPRGRGSPSAMT